MIHHRTARKDYCCCNCRRTIEVGEKYHHHGAGRRECLRCRPSEFEATPSLSIELLTEWREKAIRALLDRYPDDDMLKLLSSIDACIQDLFQRRSDVASLSAAANDAGLQPPYRTDEEVMPVEVNGSATLVASNDDSLDTHQTVLIVHPSRS